MFGENSLSLWGFLNSMFNIYFTTVFAITEVVDQSVGVHNYILPFHVLMCNIKIHVITTSISVHVCFRRIHWYI